MQGKKLKIFLIENDMLQSDICKEFGVSQSAVSQWCTGHVKVPDYVIEFCKNYKGENDD